MKRIALITACAACCPIAAVAQSNVTLYGMMDAGVDFVSNHGGSRDAVMDTGIMSPNLFGLRGREDLGGGLSAVFVLEGQYEVGSGVSDGGLFGRQAYVGLNDARYGSLTLGNQYDFMFTSLALKRYGPELAYVSLQNLRQGPFSKLGIPSPLGGSFDFDRVAGSQRIQNAVKYTSPDLAGFSFGAMYGFGNQPGAFGNSSAQSFGADYSRGPISIDAAYTYVKYPQFSNGNDGIRTWGVGGRVAVAAGFVDALYTNTKNTQTGGGIQVFEIGGTYPLWPQWMLAASYQYMKGNDQLDNNKAHQVNLTLDYALSKLTDVYISGTYQRAIGDDADAWILGLPGASDSHTQAAVRLGMRHVF